MRTLLNTKESERKVKPYIICSLKKNDHEGLFKIVKKLILTIYFIAWHRKN